MKNLIKIDENKLPIISIKQNIIFTKKPIKKLFGNSKYDKKITQKFIDRNSKQIISLKTLHIKGIQKYFCFIPINKTEKVMVIDETNLN